MLRFYFFGVQYAKLQNDYAQLRILQVLIYTHKLLKDRNLPPEHILLSQILIPLLKMVFLDIFAQHNAIRTQNLKMILSKKFPSLVNSLPVSQLRLHLCHSP